MNSFTFPSYRLAIESDAPGPEERLADETRVQELGNDYIAAAQVLLYTGEEAFHRTRGQEALVRAEATWNALAELRSDLLAHTANAWQRRRLGEQLGGLMAAAKQGIQRHVAWQTAEWQKETALGRQALVAQEAALAWADIDKVEGLALASESAAREVARIMRVKAPEAVQVLTRQARLDVYGRAVDAALAADGRPQAEVLFGRVKDRINAEQRGDLQRQLEAARNYQMAGR